MDEKRALEQAAAEEFVEAINRITGSRFQIIRHHDKPDIVIADSLTGRTIGVEVTHLFYDEEEARLLLGRPVDSVPAFKIETMEEFTDRLNELLAQKAEKSDGYEFSGELGLLVRVVSPMFTKADFDRYERLIRVPDNDYHHIWLLFCDFDREKWDIIKQLQ